MSSTPEIDDGQGINQNLFSWVALAISCLHNMIIVGYLDSIGILFVEWQISFNASAKAVSWIGAIVGLFTLLAMYIAGIVVTRFYCRTILLLGGVLTSLVTFTSAWTKQLWQLYVLFIFQGIGTGFVYATSMIVLEYYFKKNIALATGIGFAGNALGVIVIPPILAALSNKFNWHVALIITSVMMLTVTICGTLLKPTEREIFMHKNIANESKYTNASPETCEERDKSKVVEEEAPKYILKRVVYLTGIDLLLLNKDLLFACLSYCSFTLAFYSTILYLSSLAVFDVGLSKTLASFLTTAMGVGSVCGRVVPGFLTDRNICKAMVFFTFAPILASVSIFAMPNIDSFAGLLICALWFGAFTGTTNGIVSSYVRSISSPSQFSRSFGLLFLFHAIGSSCGVISMGYLQDVFQSYDVSFYFGGAACVLSSSVSFINILRHRCSGSRNSSEKACTDTSSPDI